MRFEMYRDSLSAEQRPTPKFLERLSKLRNEDCQRLACRAIEHKDMLLRDFNIRIPARNAKRRRNSIEEVSVAAPRSRARPAAAAVHQSVLRDSSAVGTNFGFGGDTFWDDFDGDLSFDAGSGAPAAAAESSVTTTPSCQMHQLRFTDRHKLTSLGDSYYLISHPPQLPLSRQRVGRQGKSVSHVIRSMHLFASDEDGAFYRHDLLICSCATAAARTEAVLRLIASSQANSLRRCQLDAVLAAVQSCEHETQVLFWTKRGDIYSGYCEHCGRDHPLHHGLPSVPLPKPPPPSGPRVQERADYSPESIFGLGEFGHRGTWVVAASSGDTGIVHVDRKGTAICANMACQKAGNQRRCPHVQRLRLHNQQLSMALIGSDSSGSDTGADDDDHVQGAPRVRRSPSECTTPGPIELPLSPHVITRVDQINAVLLAIRQRVTADSAILLQDTHCRSCGDLLTTWAPQLNKNSVLLTKFGEFPAQVNRGICATCGSHDFSGGGFVLGVNNDRLYCVMDQLVDIFYTAFRCRTSVFSIYKKNAAAFAATKCVMEYVTYDRFLALFWAMCAGVMSGLDRDGKLNFSCPDPSCMELPVSAVVDATFASTATHNVPKAHPLVPGAVHPRALQHTHRGANGGLLVSTADRQQLVTYVKDADTHEIVAPEAREVPNTDLPELNALIAAFHIAPGPRQDVLAYRLVKEFVFNISTGTPTDSMFMGGSPAAVLIASRALYAELLRAVPRADLVQSHFASLRQECSYLYKIAHTLYLARWLHDATAATRNFLSVVQKIASRAAQRPGAQHALLEGSVYCAACDPTLNDFTFAIAVRHGTERAVSDTQIIFLNKHLGLRLVQERALPTSKRPLPVLSDPHTERVIAHYGSCALLYGGWESREAAAAFMAEMNWLTRKDYEFTVVIDDHNNELKKQSPGSIWTAPCVRPWCQFENDVCAEKRCERKDHTRPGSTHGHGVLTGICRHNHFIFSVILDQNESSRVVAQEIWTHFPFCPIIHYDMACRLLGQFYVRDPHYVKGAIIALDNLHMWNHTACSTVLRSEQHPALAGINTQAAEQVNAIIDDLKAYVPYMTYEHNVLYMKLFMFVSNQAL